MLFESSAPVLEPEVDLELNLAELDSILEVDVVDSVPPMNV